MRSSNRLNKERAIGVFGKTIDKDIPIPLYYQIKTHLREHVEMCADGDLIPTETELCEHFAVSRPTVRQAINGLVNEGCLRRRKGKGTFVVKQKLQRDFLLTFETYDQEIIDHGRTPRTRILSVQRTHATEHVAYNLQIPTDSWIYTLRRVRYTDDTPLMMVTSYLPADLLPDFDKDSNAISNLHLRMERHYGYRLQRATRAIEAVASTEMEAPVLQIPVGSPLQYIETRVYLENDRCIEFSNAWYRGDQSRFTIELLRSHLDTQTR